MNRDRDRDTGARLEEQVVRSGRLRPLRAVVQEEIRQRVLAGEWAVGERLPTEDELCREFGVSRVTVRSAIQGLVSQGLVDVRHGSGTYVATFGGQLRAGLQELRSMTEVIRELGHTGGSLLDWKEIRFPTEVETSQLGIVSDSQVVSLERTWMADGAVVGYSFDVIPADVLPPGFAEGIGSESTFAAFRRCGIEPTRAMAELHAVSAVPPRHGSTMVEGSLYLLLNQVHYDRGARAIMYSRTYFVEGRFSFVILRTA